MAFEQEKKRGVAKPRLAVLTTHPIQYQAPWFRALHACPEVELTVLFGHRATPGEQSAAGFDVEFDWDVPLLDGYSYRFLRNVAKRPSVTTFFGVDAPEAGRLVREGNFDAVLVNGWHYKAAWQAIAACRRSGTPVMARGDSHLHTPRRRWKSLLKAVPYRWFIPRFDACLAVGRWSSDYFRAYGAAEERIFLAPHVVDRGWVASAPPSQERVAEIRRRWDIPPDAFAFLFVGKFIDLKRPADFIAAVAKTSRANPRTFGWMVGDGPLLKECRRMAAETGAPICFSGFLNQSQLPEIYRAADALVVPSSEETWGMVVDEAMAFGLPCLVSDQVGCRPDRVRPGETGFVFPVGDVGTLSDSMTRLGGGEMDVLAMRRNALKMSENNAPKVAVEGVVRALKFVNARREKAR